MSRLVWLVAAALFGVAAVSIWVAFQSPSFWIGIATAVASAIGGALLPVVFRRKPPDEEAIDRDYARRGQVRPTKHRPHPGER